MKTADTSRGEKRLKRYGNGWGIEYYDDVENPILWIMQYGRDGTWTLKIMKIDERGATLLDDSNFTNKNPIPLEVRRDALDIWSKISGETIGSESEEANIYGVWRIEFEERNNHVGRKPWITLNNNRMYSQDERGLRPRNQDARKASLPLSILCGVDEAWGEIVAKEKSTVSVT